MGKLFIISAPSGAGKTTLVNALIERCQKNYCLKKVITYTTKEPRSNEKQAVDYYFISQQEFKKKIEQGFFVEFSTAYGAYYGSPASILDDLAEGESLLVILDRTGAHALKRIYNKAVLIWIEPPHFSCLEERLKSRATEQQESIKFRLSLAQKELNEQKQEQLFDYTIINNTVAQALEHMHTIIADELG